MKFDGSIPSALRDSFYKSFENNDLWLDVTFPTNSDNKTAKTCSGRSFKGNHEVNNTAGINEMEITIPVMSVWRLGNVEHYTGKQADLCFQEDNQIACDAMSAEQIKSSDCDGEACYVKCTKNCNGYYMVRAEDKIPIIVGISLGVLIIVSTILGSPFISARILRNGTQSRDGDQANINHSSFQCKTKFKTVLETYVFKCLDFPLSPIFSTVRASCSSAGQLAAASYRFCQAWYWHLVHSVAA